MAMAIDACFIDNSGREVLRFLALLHGRHPVVGFHNAGGAHTAMLQRGRLAIVPRQWAGGAHGGWFTMPPWPQPPASPLGLLLVTGLAATGMEYLGQPLRLRKRRRPAVPAFFCSSNRARLLECVPGVKPGASASFWRQGHCLQDAGGSLVIVSQLWTGGVSLRSTHLEFHAAQRRHWRALAALLKGISPSGFEYFACSPELAAIAARLGLNAYPSGSAFAAVIG